MPPRHAAAAAALLCALAQPACAAGRSNSSSVAWVACSPDEGTCKCKGSVRYGAKKSWIVKDNVQGNISCSAAEFGNPVVACDKIAADYLPHCECKEEWMPCAPENGECGCEGTVRYGAGLEWNFKHGLRSLSVACTTAEFGDPAPGVAKACECIAVDTCTDLTFPNGELWHDNGITAFNCFYYANSPWFYERGCVDNGRNDGGIYTASEACCVCGGGKRTHTEGATDDTLSPLAPTPVPTCTDLTWTDHRRGGAWYNSDYVAKTCSWFADRPSHARCRNFGDDDRNIYTANEACCVCGGGKRTHPAMSTGESPVSVSGVSGRSETTLRIAAVAAAAVLVIGAVCLLFLRRSRQGAAYFKPQEPVSQRPESVEIDQIAIVE